MFSPSFFFFCGFPQKRCNLGRVRREGRGRQGTKRRVCLSCNESRWRGRGKRCHNRTTCDRYVTACSPAVSREPMGAQHFTRKTSAGSDLWREATASRRGGVDVRCFSAPGFCQRAERDSLRNPPGISAANCSRA